MEDAFEAFETTNGSTGGSKIGLAILAFAWDLIIALIVGVPVGFVLGISFFKVLAVSLALATLGSLIPVLDFGWFAVPLEMSKRGLVVASLVWLVFSTGFFTVLAVSLVLGLSIPLLRGKEFRERERNKRKQYQKQGREGLEGLKQRRQEEKAQKKQQRRQEERAREEQRRQEARLREAEEKQLNLRYAL